MAMFLFCCDRCFLRGNGNVRGRVVKENRILDDRSRSTRRNLLVNGTLGISVFMS